MLNGLFDDKILLSPPETIICNVMLVMSGRLGPTFH